MESLSRSCLRGAELRGRLAQQLLTKTQWDFALIVFPEIHHGAHHLWHTADFDPVVHSGFNSESGTVITPSLEDVCREIDRQIGILTETVGSDCLVMVFSLHGMRPCAGVSSFLPELLCEKGFASLSEWSKQSWRDRARSLLARVKRRAPRIARELYYRTLSLDATRSLAAPTILPVYDWSSTRAFSLPTDQHGWIRINLNGRERDGIVLPKEYEQTCAELESLMRNLCREDGAPLVEEVVRTAPAATARSSKLPDLVVHWADSAFQTGQKINDSEVVTETISRKFTGQHARDGFCIIKGGYDIAKSDTLSATDMHRVIEHWLGC
jgi:predicted AlkP superfamily phosphohydrolase/phosphomutase